VAAVVSALAAGGVLLGEHLAGSAVSERSGDHAARAAAVGVEWEEGAAEDVAQWAEGAAGDFADWAEGATADVTDWAPGAAGDAVDWAAGPAEDMGDWTADAAGRGHAGLAWGRLWGRRRFCDELVLIRVTTFGWGESQRMPLQRHCIAWAL